MPVVLTDFLSCEYHAKQHLEFLLQPYRYWYLLVIFLNILWQIFDTDFGSKLIQKLAFFLTEVWAKCIILDGYKYNSCIYLDGLISIFCIFLDGWSLKKFIFLDRNIFKNLENLGKKVRLWRFSAESFACSGTFFDGSYIFMSELSRWYYTFMSELLLKHHTFMREV